MDYKQMREIIEKNHSALFGDSMQEIKETEAVLDEAKTNYPELYRQAQDDYNAWLRSL